MRKKSVFVLLIFGLLALGMFSGFVSAQDVFDPVRDMFAEWQKGQLSVNIAKYVIWLMLIIVVYSIILIVPMLKKLNLALKFLLALVISFLATAYLTPSDVYTTLASYTALGIVLSAILPFVLLLFFSVEISKSEHGGAAGIIFSKIMWTAFIVFLIYKIFYGVYVADVINITQGWIYVAFIILSILWLFGADRWVFAKIVKEETYQHKTRFEEEIELQRAKRRAEAADVKGT